MTTPMTRPTAAETASAARVCWSNHDSLFACATILSQRGSALGVGAMSAVWPLRGVQATNGSAAPVTQERTDMHQAETGLGRFLIAQEPVYN
jgi:hypothetical protein